MRTVLILLIVVLAYMVLPSVVRAGVGIWTTGGPYAASGDRVRFLVEGKVVFLSGAQDPFISTNAGQSWSRVELPLASAFRVPSPLRFFESSGGKIFAVDGDESVIAIYVSSDQGHTWATFSSQALEPHSIYSFMWDFQIDPHNSSMMYADFTNLDNAGFFRSTDGGKTWNESIQGLPSDLGDVQAIVPDPKSAGVVYAMMLYSDNGNPIFKSTDYGASWKHWGSGMGIYLSQDLAIDATNNSTQYAVGTDKTEKKELLFKTTNGGLNWKPLNCGCEPFEVKVDSTAPNKVYVVTQAGISRSTDYGNTWLSLKVPFYGINQSGSSLAISPIDGSLLLVAGSDILRSTDAGVSWVPSSHGIDDVRVKSVVINPVRPSELLVPADLKLFRTTNSGTSWKVSARATGATLSSLRYSSATFHPKNPQLVFVAGGGCNAISHDDGKTWSTHCLNVGGSGGIFDPDDQSVIYSSSGKWENEGSVWVPYRFGMPKIGLLKAVAADPKNGSRLYVGTNNGTIVRSVNAGLTWQKLNVASQYVGALAINPSNSNIVYAAAKNGIFKSTDSGQTWVSSSSGLGCVPDFLVLDPRQHSTLYTGCGNPREFGGIAISTDGGRSWRPFDTTGLGDFGIHDMAISPAVPMLFLGTDRGVYQYTLAN